MAAGLEHDLLDADGFGDLHSGGDGGDSRVRVKAHQQQSDLEVVLTELQRVLEQLQRLHLHADTL